MATQQVSRQHDVTVGRRTITISEQTVERAIQACIRAARHFEELPEVAAEYHAATDQLVTLVVAMAEVPE